MPNLADYRARFKCSFPQAQDVFEACMIRATQTLSKAGIDEYLDAASRICMMGRGVEPVLVYLEEAPEIADALGEAILKEITSFTFKLNKSPNGKALVPFLQSLAPVARRLECPESMVIYLQTVIDTMQATTPSIHGFHAILNSPCLIEFLESAPRVLQTLSLSGFKNWINYGIKVHANNPDGQREYFSLASPDSLSILQRERHGTLLVDHERQLDATLKALWDTDLMIVPYPTALEEGIPQTPYIDAYGLRVPDIYDDRNGVSGIDRYRALIAHLINHKHHSTKLLADNFSPMQRFVIELLEDCRIEALAMRQYPGLRRIWMGLHPAPLENACNESKEACLRHRAAMLSYAILNPNHGYTSPVILEYVDKFHTMMVTTTSTRDVVDLAVSFVVRTRLASDSLPNIYFFDTEIDYRDDNRHLWIFNEEDDEGEITDLSKKPPPDKETALTGLPPRHYPEWDYHSESYKPDWVSLFETLHPSAQASTIDKLLEKHAGIARQLKQLIDMIKPQNKVRIRYQEDGSELDLDVAIRSLIDYKGGSSPDPRINMSHKTDGRDFAVSLLIDLSASVGNKAAGSTQTILELSQEAVSLLAWAVDKMGDPLAIAGFDSNTRHEVRYRHIKGFNEAWDDGVKARLAAMQPGQSTRMGAALRHAGHYLEHRNADKKLLLVLTDGEPADIDSKDPQALISDTREAVKELNQKGIATYCINLDPNADKYVADIFGKHYTVIDHVDRLPERLPQLFISLTK
jgi:nitric oxide reductase activation protein